MNVIKTTALTTEPRFDKEVIMRYKNGVLIEQEELSFETMQPNVTYVSADGRHYCSLVPTESAE